MFHLQLQKPINYKNSKFRNILKTLTLFTTFMNTLISFQLISFIFERYRLAFLKKIFLPKVPNRFRYIL